MKELVSIEMQDHLEEEVTTLCTCWKVVRTDGVVLGFTDHDQDLTIDSVTYDAQTGYNRTAIANGSDFSVDNMDIDGFLESDLITENDLRNGLFNYAKVYVSLVNWMDPEAGGFVPLRVGWFGEVTISQNGMFNVELRGLQQALSYNFMENFSPECRANFCDARCKLNIADFTQSVVVDAVYARDFFSINTTGMSPPVITFSGGKVVFTSGQNAGKAMEIVGYDTGDVTMFSGLPYPIEIGDELDIIEACDKRQPTCSQYNNIKNFRGEPHVPGTDTLVRYPDAG